MVYQITCTECYSTYVVVVVAVVGQVCDLMPGLLQVPLLYLQWTMSLLCGSRFLQKQNILQVH